TFCADANWSQPELRRALRGMLPDYMIPSEFVSVQCFPLTPAGKIDREGLRTGYRSSRQVQVKEMPKTGTESLLAEIWARVFERNDIGRFDNFFSLGGDSLIAARIAAHVYDLIKVDLNLAVFADHPKLADLALVIDERSANDADNTTQLIPLARIEPLPISFWQERTGNFSRTAAGSAGYTVARVYRIVGPLNVELLCDCINELVSRHEILRTTFEVRGKHPVQIVHELLSPLLTYIDVTAASDPIAQADLVLKKEAAHAFDLTRGPLLRFCVVTLRDTEYRLCQVAHHIICDSASWLIYYRELAVLYEAKLKGGVFLIEMPSLQYGDYAAWQRKMLNRNGQSYKRSVAWWKENLSGKTSTLDFPFRRTKGISDVVPADGTIFWDIERGVSYRLNTLGLAHNVTRLMVRLAAFAALLAAETDDYDVIIGMYVDNRNLLQLQNMIGYFSNLITLRFRCEPKKSFVEWLSIVRGQILEAYAHSEIPYEMLCDELRRHRETVPEIKAIFHVFRHQTWTIDFANIRLIRTQGKQETIPWGFTLVVDDQNETKCQIDDQHTQELCQVAFDPRIYDPSDVRIFVERYKQLLDCASRNPNTPLSELLAMSGAARKSLLRSQS